MFTIHTLHLLFYIWPVYIINIHVWQVHFLVSSEHLSSTFCCCHCCCLLWKWARAFPRIFCTVTLTKITSDITWASGWARLLVSTFFPHWFIFICTSYQRKLRWKGKTPRFSFLLWLASLTRERHPASTWFRNSQVQSKSKPMRATRTSQHRPASKAFGTVLEGQEEPSQWEAVVTSRGEAAGEACECRSIIKTREGPGARSYGSRKGPGGLVQDNTVSLSLHHRNCRPRISCLTSRFGGLTILQ